MQEAYWSMASALSEADGIDYTDPEEVEISTCSCSWSEWAINVIMFQCLSIYHSLLSEQLELLIATLIDLDAMDGKSSVSLLAECSSSPDVNTR